MSDNKENVVSDKLHNILKVFGLEDEEIDTYFKISNYKSISKNDISKLINIAPKQTENIIKNLISKGLIKKLAGKKSIYQALPPYSVLFTQTSQIKSYIDILHNNISENFKKKLEDSDGNSVKLKKLEDCQNYIQNFKDEIPHLVNKELKSLQSGLEAIRKLENFNNFVVDVKRHVLKELNAEFKNFRQMFENIKNKISNVFEKQLRISTLKAFVDKIVSKIISEEFGQVDDFERRFSCKIDNTIDISLKKFSGLPEVSQRYSFSVTDTTENIANRLTTALKNWESKLTEVQVEISDSYDDHRKKILKEIEKIIETDIFNKIFEQLDKSEKSMREFWSIIKQTSMATPQNEEKKKY
ncbi:MAG: helix-turn-helix domain-containing protein [Candidatus Helarchaeota archaeon]